MVVYADVLVCLNVFVNYFLLRGTARLVHIHIGTLRLLLGALVGGAYSLVIFIPDLPEILSFLMNSAVCIVIVSCCFAPFGLKKFIKCFLAFFGVNFIFAGFMLAVWLVLRPDGMVYNNSVVYFDIDIKILVASTVACYLVLTLTSFFMKRNVPDNRIYDITLYNKGRTVMTKALLDTGNSLSDGFSDMPVIIADRQVVQKLIDFSLNDYFDGNNALTIEHPQLVRLIPFNTVGENGLLKAVKIDTAEIENIRLGPVLIAQSNSQLDDAQYSAILNCNIFDERGMTNVKKAEKTSDKNKMLSLWK